MKKRMTSLVLALAMCLSLCTTVFADPGASVEEKRAYLLNTCNIPADFLDSATSDTISSLYEDATKNYIILFLRMRWKQKVCFSRSKRFLLWEIFLRRYEVENLGYKGV